jgi:hypothetical protein
MNKSFGLQVTRDERGFFDLILMSQEFGKVSILDPRPPQIFTLSSWRDIRRRCFQQVKAWLEEEDSGYGIIVFNGVLYEFDRPRKQYVRDWPEGPRKALDWIRRRIAYL